MSEQASAITRELIHGAFEQSPIGIVVVDARGDIVVVNRELEHLLRYPRDELIGQPVERLIPEQFALRHRAVRLDYLQHAETRAMGAGREFHARHRDGHSILVEIGLSAITVGNDHFVLSTVVDVTERRQLEMQMMRAQKLEAIGNFASGIAHDFNNILLGILGHAELANEDASLSSNARDHLGDVIEGILQGRDLVARMLTYGRNGNLTLSPIHWEPVLQDALKLMRASLPPNVGIDIQVNPNVATVWADPIELQQIFMNLVTNAAHSMSHKGGIIVVQVADVQLDQGFVATHPGLASDRHIRLSLIDEGVGMPPSVVAHIFEPFFTTKSPDEGTGLGLSIVQRVIKRLGGAIVVDSREGEGTRMDVYLPVSNGEDAPALPDEKVSYSRQCVAPSNDE